MVRYGMHVSRMYVFFCQFPYEPVPPNCVPDSNPLLPDLQQFCKGLALRTFEFLTTLIFVSVHSRTHSESINDEAYGALEAMIICWALVIWTARQAYGTQTEYPQAE